MTLSLLPTPDDRRTNATFEELMWALSRPGLMRTLPDPGLEVVGESLLDRECSFHVIDDAELHRALCRTGARPACLDGADYVFAAIDAADKVAALSALRAGTLAYPDEAATLFAPASFGSGRKLRLSGPGIKESLTIELAGVADSFWRMRADTIRYPLGWDLYLIDGDRLVGIPRSTTIEVL